MLNGLLLNFALLIAGTFVLSLTYHQPHLRASWRRITGRYALTVGVAFLLLFNSVHLVPGLLFDFRTVLVALAGRRNGVLAGLLVAVPIALYRLHLGGAAAWAGVLNLLLVALLAGWSTGTFRLTPRLDPGLLRAWWLPFGLFGLTNLTTFLAFHLAGQPPVQAAPIYVVFTILSALGMLVGHLVTQTRLQALHHTEKMEHLAYLDPLTGSFNRRRFDLDLRAPLQPAYLLLLDLDHFKHVNDSHGHDVGDRVLTQTVRVLRGVIRPTDRIYRLGGEEFAVLLSPCEESGARRVAERLREAVAGQVGPRAGLPEGAVTVSGGLVRVDGERRATLRTADALLYQAKAAGRDRIASDVSRLYLAS